MRHPEGENPLPFILKSIGDPAFIGRTPPDFGEGFLRASMKRNGLDFVRIDSFPVWTKEEDEGKQCVFDKGHPKGATDVKHGMGYPMLVFTGRDFVPCCEFPAHEVYPILNSREIKELLLRGGNPVKEAFARFKKIEAGFFSEGHGPKHLSNVLGAYRSGCVACKRRGTMLRTAEK